MSVGVREEETREVVEDCARVLEAFGVTPAAVRSRWNVAPAADDSLVGAVAAVLRRTGQSPAAVVRAAVAAGERCVDAPARYWDTALQIGLARVFADVGASVTVRDADGTRVDEGGTEQPFTVAVTDADGQTHGVTFSYPNTPMGRDNYAAVVHAVDAGLLDTTGYTFVPVAGPTDRWRFALVQAGDLAGLRERLGDRVELAGDPVLAARPASAYVPTDGDVYVPPWVDQYDDGSVAAATAREVFDVDAFIEARDGPEVEAVLDGEDPDDIAAGSTPDPEPATAADPGADADPLADEFDAFVAALAEMGVPEPEPVAPTEPTDAGDGSVADADATEGVAVDPDAAVDPFGADGEGLDRAFAEIEREAAAETAGAHRVEMHDADAHAVVEDVADSATTTRISDDAFGVDAVWNGGSETVADGGHESDFEWVDDGDLAAR
jgi:hypothetical protein